MQLDHLAVGHTGSLVQTINVLGDDSGHLALIDQAGERAMTSIRGGLLHHLVARELATPGLTARLARGKEVAKLDRLVLGPYASRRTIIGDPRLGGDAGTGERDHAFRIGDHAPQLVDLPHEPPSLTSRNRTDDQSGRSVRRTNRRS